MVTIRTNYKTNAAGKGQIVAKGGGKQRTFPYAHEKSVRANHRDAADVVAQLLGKSIFPGTHTVEVDNGKATFVLH